MVITKTVRGKKKHRGGANCVRKKKKEQADNC